MASSTPYDPKLYCAPHLPPRDMKGYGMDPPDAQWPNGAKIAISFALNFEEGGERSIENGDPVGENYLCEVIGKAPPPAGWRDLNTESMFEYGTRAGFPRLLRLFEQYNFRFTCYCVTKALELSPHFAQLIEDGGHEMASHGNRWISYADVPAEEEEDHIRTSLKVLASSTGSGKNTPKGHYIGRTSLQTRRLICRVHKQMNLPLAYVSDNYADDLPYYERNPLADEGDEDEGLLILPYTLDCNDFRFLLPGSGWAGTDDFYNYLVDTFDTLYEEGLAGKPKFMNVGLHCRIVGKPGRITALRKFMEYISKKDGVWVARRDEVASHWREVHPYVKK